MKVLWTDGSCAPNPGPGGCAVIEDGKPVKLARNPHSTNIRMEGRALAMAMQYAGDEPCEIHTDSEFWVKVLTDWAPKWEENDWKKKSRGEIENIELVIELWQLYQKGKVKLVWERGHVGTEMNELADEWANKARAGLK